MKKIRCPICGGKQVTKKGKRETRYKSRQIYYCKSCGKKFVENKLRNKTYSPKVIINAISYYNLGFPLDDASRLVNRRFKVKTSKSSVHNWINEFSDICSFRKIRGKVLKDFDRDVVFTNSFEHQGLEYKFRYHKAKLKKLASNYPGLVRYLKRFEEGCPSEFFEGGERCSQLRLKVKVKESGRRNQACKLAELALKAVDYNRQRHEIVEKFMLINDIATIACEIPVWLWEKNLDVGIFGHIDLLQIRRGNVYILDFKPGASKENRKKVASQLYLYASGLSFRTSIPLEKIRCAWFDDQVYYDLIPPMPKSK